MGVSPQLVAECSTTYGNPDNGKVYIYIHNSHFTTCWLYTMAYGWEWFRLKYGVFHTENGEFAKPNWCVHWHPNYLCLAPFWMESLWIINIHETIFFSSMVYIYITPIKSRKTTSKTASTPTAPLFPPKLILQGPWNVKDLQPPMLGHFLLGHPDAVHSGALEVAGTLLWSTFGWTKSTMWTTHVQDPLSWIQGFF